MSKNLKQIFDTNPITTNTVTDLMYFMQSPYTAGTDAAMEFQDFAAQFISSTPGASGTILRSNGTAWVATTATFADTYAASTILYSNGANTVTGLATANNGILVTSGTGVPSISSTLPTAVQTNITNLGIIDQNVFLSPVTAGSRYLGLNGNASLTGKLVVQAGSGSGGYGGAINLFSHAHASKPGWVTAGLSLSSGGKFSVNTNALATGTDVFTVDSAGNVTATSISFSSTSGIIGTTTNDNAAAGSVGELITSQIVFASRVNLTSSGTAQNVTSISLTAGTWDVTGLVGFLGAAGTTVTYLRGWINDVSATTPDPSLYSADVKSGAIFAAGKPVSFALLTRRFNLASTTTIYLTALAGFAVDTLSIYGYIRATRIR